MKIIGLIFVIIIDKIEIWGGVTIKLQQFVMLSTAKSPREINEWSLLGTYVVEKSDKITVFMENILKYLKYKKSNNIL